MFLKVEEGCFNFRFYRFPIESKEQFMADVNTSQTVETRPGNGESATGRPRAEGQELSAPFAGQEESSTKGMLREAIQKVMEEIEHHEREAKKHLQQAKALRKDLRDSFAFLQERKDDEPAEVADKIRSSMAADPEGTKATEAARTSKPHREIPKKKSVSKGKSGPKT
jgi:hypothetical protein